MRTRRARAGTNAVLKRRRAHAGQVIRKYRLPVLRCADAQLALAQRAFDRAARCAVAAAGSRQRGADGEARMEDLGRGRVVVIGHSSGTGGRCARWRRPALRRAPGRFSPGGTLIMRRK
jgi:hypothetical protein